MPDQVLDKHTPRESARRKWEEWVEWGVLACPVRREGAERKPEGLRSFLALKTSGIFRTLPLSRSLSVLAPLTPVSFTPIKWHLPVACTILYICSCCCCWWKCLVFVFVLAFWHSTNGIFIIISRTCPFSCSP